MIVGRLAVWLILAYQAARGPRPPCCRFHPSCSNYAIEAVRAHGALRGLWMSAKRLSKCRPFGAWGFDPVPAAKAVGR